MHREDGTVCKHIPLDPDCVQKSTSPEPDPKNVLTATLTVPNTRGKGSRGKLPKKETMVSTLCSSPIWLLFFSNFTQTSDNVKTLLGPLDLNHKLPLLLVKLFLAGTEGMDGMMRMINNFLFFMFIPWPSPNSTASGGPRQDTKLLTFAITSA